MRSALPGPGQAWPAIVVDVQDDAAAAELAARTRVVATTVGPYLRYGLPLVTACAAAGTHYADLTGETLFVRRSIDAVHEVAVASGARIVHSCGFDSVPSDLGVGLTAAQATADGAGELTSAVLHVTRLRGGISGGTIDSLRQQAIEASGDPTARRLTANPWALVDEVAGRAYGSSGERASAADAERPHGLLAGAFRDGCLQRADRAPEQRPGRLAVRSRAHAIARWSTPAVDRRARWPRPASWSGPAP